MRHFATVLLAALLTGCTPWGNGLSFAPIATPTPASGYAKHRLHQNIVTAANLTVVPVNDWLLTPVSENDFFTDCFSPGAEDVGKGVTAGNPMVYTPNTCEVDNPTIHAFDIPRDVATCSLRVTFTGGVASFEIMTSTGTDTDCSYDVEANGTVYFVYNLLPGLRPHRVHANR